MRKRLSKNECEWSIIFDSAGEFLDYCASPCEMDSEHRASLTGGREFTGTDTYAEAEELARHGWPDGTKKVRALARKITGALELEYAEIKQAAALIPAPHGFIPRIPAAIAGRPDSMIHQGPSERRVIRILHNVVVSALEPQETFFVRGAALAGLVKLLSAAGYGAEVHCGLSTGSGRGRVDFVVPVKQSLFYLDESQLVYYLCHSSALRRLGFSAMEHAPKTIREKVGISEWMGYGQPLGLRADLSESYDLITPAYSYSSLPDEENAKKYMLTCLKSLGLNVEVLQT